MFFKGEKPYGIPSGNGSLPPKLAGNGEWGMGNGGVPILDWGMGNEIWGMGNETWRTGEWHGPYFGLVNGE